MKKLKEKSLVSIPAKADSETELNLITQEFIKRRENLIINEIASLASGYGYEIEDLRAQIGVKSTVSKNGRKITYFVRFGSAIKMSDQIAKVLRPHDIEFMSMAETQSTIILAEFPRL